MTLCAIALQGFQGTPRLIDNWVSLKSLLLFLVLSLFLSFLAGTARERTVAFLESALSLQPSETRSSYDVRHSRFRSLLSVIAIVVTSLFLSLCVQQILEGNISSFKDLGGWSHIVLRRVSAKSILISLAGILIYITVKVVGILIYSSVHFRSTYIHTNIDCFLSYMMLDAMLVMPLLLYNEIMPLTGQTIFWIASGIWLLTKAWSALHIYVKFSTQGITFFQFFLYFCGLEILPLPVFCKCLFLLS